MRIVELIATMSVGGAESMVAALSFELRSRGHAVHIICLQDAGDTTIPLSQFAEAGIPMVELNKGDGLSLECARRIAAYCRQHQIDIIHAHTHRVNHYAVAAAATVGGIPVVVTLHGIQALNMQPWAKALFRLTCAATSTVVGVSDAVSREASWRLGISEKQILTIPNGIDTTAFAPVSRIDNAEFVFGAVGRLVPVKNHANLINAFAQVRKRYPRTRLEIAGHGELNGELKNLARTLQVDDAVVFHGQRMDIAAFLSTLDCFVLSSDSEGLPITLLEAMSCGLPVISTAVGGVPEVVSGNEVGWLCPPRDASALARCMETALSASDIGQRRDRARATVMKLYSAQAMADQYMSVFDSALAPNSRTHEVRTASASR